MNVLVFLLNVLVVVVVSGGPAWKEVQRGGGLKIGSGGGRNSSLSRGNGIKIGTSKGGRISTTMIPEEDHLSPPTATATSGDKHTLLNVGMVLPSKLFGVREYIKAISSAKYNLQRKLSLFKNHDIKVHIVLKEITPSPTGN